MRLHALEVFTAPVLLSVCEAHRHNHARTYHSEVPLNVSAPIEPLQGLQWHVGSRDQRCREEQSVSLNLQPVMNEVTVLTDPLEEIEAPSSVYLFGVFV